MEYGGGPQPGLLGGLLRAWEVAFACMFNELEHFLRISLWGPIGLGNIYYFNPIIENHFVIYSLILLTLIFFILTSHHCGAIRIIIYSMIFRILNEKI